MSLIKSLLKKSNMLVTLQRADDSLVMAIPKVFIEQNHLCEGSRVEVVLKGTRMTINVPSKRRYKLEDLLEEMPVGKFPAMDGWDE